MTRVTLQIRLKDAAELERLQRAAARHDKSVSAYVRSRVPELRQATSTKERRAASGTSRPAEDPSPDALERRIKRLTNQGLTPKIARRGRGTEEEAPAVAAPGVGSCAKGGLRRLRHRRWPRPPLSLERSAGRRGRQTAVLPASDDWSGAS